MNTRWYQDWKSWLVIVLLLFVPTFLIGLILMWLVAPWSRRAKLWITGIGLGIPLIGIVISLLLVVARPQRQISIAADSVRRADIQQLAGSANRYCFEKLRCASSLLELKQGGYLSEIPVDPDSKQAYSYTVTPDGKNCTIMANLSDGTEFSRNCL